MWYRYQVTTPAFYTHFPLLHGFKVVSGDAQRLINCLAITGEGPELWR